MSFICLICTDHLLYEDVHVTNCGHMFHLKCISDWIKRSKSCPQCRKKCSEANIFKVYITQANLDNSVSIRNDSFCSNCNSILNQVDSMDEKLRKWNMLGKKDIESLKSSVMSELNCLKIKFNSEISSKENLKQANSEILELKKSLNFERLEKSKFQSYKKDLFKKIKDEQEANWKFKQENNVLKEKIVSFEKQFLDLKNNQPRSSNQLERKSSANDLTLKTSKFRRFSGPNQTILANGRKTEN
ncbi:TRAIP family protein [Megaselia abdita]